MDHKDIDQWMQRDSSEKKKCYSIWRIYGQYEADWGGQIQSSVYGDYGTSGGSEDFGNIVLFRRILTERDQWGSGYSGRND